MAVRVGSSFDGSRIQGVPGSNRNSILRIFQLLLFANLPFCLNLNLVTRAVASYRVLLASNEDKLVDTVVQDIDQSQDSVR